MHSEVAILHVPTKKRLRTLTFLRSFRSLLLILIVVAALSHAQSGTAQQVPGDSTTVVLLGTGTPVPDPDAFGPATAILVGDRIFVVDAGPGVMRRLTAAGLPRNRLTALFLTHLHSDHTLGYPDLLLTTWTVGRREPFDVFGPPGIRSMTDHIIEAWREDIQVRVEGLERNSADGYRVRVHEYGPGILYDSAGVRVTAFRVPHGNWKESYGFRFDTPGKTIVLSGDTAPSDSVAWWAKQADILLHETYPVVRLVPEDRPGGELWPQYMRAFHTADEELGRIARQAQPRLLLLHHIVRMGGSDDEIMEGIRRGGFGGRTVIGRDLERY